MQFKHLGRGSYRAAVVVGTETVVARLERAGDKKGQFRWCASVRRGKAPAVSTFHILRPAAVAWCRAQIECAGSAWSDAPTRRQIVTREFADWAGDPERRTEQRIAVWLRRHSLREVERSERVEPILAMSRRRAIIVRVAAEPVGCAR